MNLRSQKNQCTGEQRFLQSPLWEHFLQSEGLETFRVGGGLFVVHTLPIVGRYAYSPRGPMIVKGEKFKVKSEERDEMQKMIIEAKKRGCGWIRIEPNTKEELHSIEQEVAAGGMSMTPAPHDVQPQEILCMDISSSEEELLASMKPKTRYNIRLAEKKGVRVVVSREEKYQDAFIRLAYETARRAGIKAHPKKHYERMFEAFPEEAMQLYSAEYQGKIIAANMVVFYGDIAIYLHGGSSNEYRNVMAPFLLQWRAIQDARARGCKWYDLGGVAMATVDGRGRDAEECRKKRMSNSWSGITKFKQGLCPGVGPIQFPGTYDVVLSPLRYGLYRILSGLRRKI